METVVQNSNPPASHELGSIAQFLYSGAADLQQMQDFVHSNTSSLYHLLEDIHTLEPSVYDSSKRRQEIQVMIELHPLVRVHHTAIKTSPDGNCLWHMVKLDSGAGTNIIAREDFNSSIKLTAFGGRNIPVTWKCTIKCQVNNTTQTVKFQIIEKGKYLLWCEDCKKLKLVTFNVNNIQEDSKDRVI